MHLRRGECTSGEPGARESVGENVFDGEWKASVSRLRLVVKNVDVFCRVGSRWFCAAA